MSSDQSLQRLQSLHQLPAHRGDGVGKVDFLDALRLVHLEVEPLHLRLRAHRVHLHHEREVREAAAAFRGCGRAERQPRRRVSLLACLGTGVASVGPRPLLRATRGVVLNRKVLRGKQPGSRPRTVLAVEDAEGGKVAD